MKQNKEIAFRHVNATKSNLHFGRCAGDDMWSNLFCCFITFRRIISLMNMGLLILSSLEVNNVFGITCIQKTIFAPRW